MEKLPDKGLACEKRLSKNEDKAILPETQDELLVDKIRDLIRAEENDIKVYQQAMKDGMDFDQTFEGYDSELAKVRRWAVDFNSVYSNIFATRDAVAFITRMLKLGSHFRSSSYIKVGWLRETLAGKHGGVSVFQFLLVTYE
jgi:hypothetical protein